MNVRFTCPQCEVPCRLEWTGPIAWQCPHCTQRLELHGPEAGGPLAACAVCGNPELYKKKDFPHWLGLAILTVACLGFVLLNALYQQ